jgi:hypothetical protein
MPSIKDQELQALIYAIEHRLIEPKANWGIKEICEACPMLAARCNEDKKYRKDTIVWWSKNKQKFIPNAYINRLEFDLPPSPSAPSPSEADSAVQQFVPSQVKPIDIPPPKKDHPKKPLPRPFVPTPAKSPSETPEAGADYAEHSGDDSPFFPKHLSNFSFSPNASPKPKSSPAKSSPANQSPANHSPAKKSPAKKSPAKKSPTKKSLSNSPFTMSDESAYDRCKRLNEEQPAAASEYGLNLLEGRSGIFHIEKVFWPNSNEIVYSTIKVFGMYDMDASPPLNGTVMVTATREFEKLELAAARESKNLFAEQLTNPKKQIDRNAYDEMLEEKHKTDNTEKLVSRFPF